MLHKLKIIVSLLYHIQHDTIMPIQKYEVSLSAEERKQLTKIVKSGNMPARTILRANILLAVDRNGKQPMTVQEAAIAFNTSATTVQNVRTRYGEKGLDATIQRKKRETPPVEAKVTGDVEAHIIALACGDPPKGYAKWTLRLLADRSVKLGYIESISHTQVGRILKKNEYKPHLKKCWCIPASHNAAFVAAMEDVLEVYSRPYDAKHPVVCMDEKPAQLLAEARDGFTSNSTGVRYEDNEYVRNGTCSIFLFTEPLAGWREAVAKRQRTRTESGCLTRDTQMSSRSYLYVTISILTISHPFTRRLNRRRLSAWQSVLKYTTRQSTAAGLT